MTKPEGRGRKDGDRQRASEEDALRGRIASLESELRARGAAQAPSADPDFLSIARSSPDIVTLLDRDLNIRYINRLPDADPSDSHQHDSHQPDSHQPDARSPDEVIGCSILENLPEAFARSVEETFEAVARTREPGGYQSESVGVAGQISYWDTTVDAVVRDGDVVGFSTHARDITESRHQHAVQERFFHLSVDMLCVANFEGYFSRVNPAFSRTLGYSTGELLSRPILTFVEPKDRDRTVEALETLFVGEAVIDFENRYRRQDGKVRWISWRAGSDPNRREIYAVARDVTERKELEAQLLQSQKLEAIGELAGGLAHDFNNLVLAIRSNVTFARKRRGAKVDSADPLDMIDEASRRAEGLVGQLLSFTEHKPPKREFFDFEQRTRDVLDLVQSLLPAGVSTRLEVRPGAPVKILGDSGQLEQVVMNLCLNARDALPEGGEIEIRFEQLLPAPGRGEWLRLSVIDHGTGMGEGVRAQIFDPFFTTKEQGKGTGLGLSTVYGIVRRHAGKISVESELGLGTTFRVDLPVGTADAASAPVLEETLESIHGQETLLVAEDEELVRVVLDRILGAAGYDVIFACDGNEAVEKFEEHRDRIELVYLDHVMPGRSGGEVLREIRRTGSDVPVLLSSGFRRRHGGEETAEDPEPDAFLSKPFQPPELLALIRQLLEQKAQRAP